MKVAQETWSTEIQKWLPHLSYSKILGSEKKRLAALQTQADIYIVNRENVVWLVEHYKNKWPFKIVVVDELSSFKSSKAKRFRALRKVRGKIDRIIGLTGTPAPNSLVDLWPQMYLLDQGERLETSQTRYKDKYFTPLQQSGHIVYTYALKRGAEDTIHEKISDICISMKAKDFLKLPGRVNNTVRVDIDLKRYKQFERELVLEMKDAEITASNAAVLANKLMQFTAGAIYDEDKQTHYIHDEKLDALERIVEDSQGQPILVFYQFKHDLERIKARFPQAEELTDIEKYHQPQRCNNK